VRVLVFRQDPDFLDVLVDAAVNTALRLGQRLRLVEPVVVAGVAWLLVSLHGRDRTAFAAVATRGGSLAAA
jgi:hypothetical protein